MQVFIFIILNIVNIHQKLSFNYSFQKSKCICLFFVFLLNSMVILK
jgi:hypothetical protein